jgi:hypothetical protein
MGAGSWAGVCDLALFGGMVLPGSSCPPPHPPALDGLNSRAFLRKCLSWQQLQPTRARLGLPSFPLAMREEKEAEPGRAGAGLGARPGHYSTVKVARQLRAAAACWCVLRGNGERQGRESAALRSPSCAGSHLLKGVQSRGGVGRGGSGCGRRYSTVAARRGNKGSVCKWLASCSSYRSLNLILT